MSTARPIPTLKTERLILRPPVLADIDAYCDILMSERDYVFADLCWQTAVSYIDRANGASIRLATKLGAVLDLAADRPEGYPDCQVYRHPHPQVLA